MRIKNPFRRLVIQTEIINRYPEAETQIAEAIERLKMQHDLELAPSGTIERVQQLKQRGRLVQIQLDEAKLALGK